MRCEPAHHFTVAKARAWRSAIDDAPVYQRGGDAWTPAQRQRFIDSLLNGYDVPKIYLHDLRGQHPTKVYAVVDGKQRLTAIWSYLADGFALHGEFHVEGTPDASIGDGGPPPAGALRFSELGPSWRQRLLDTYLSVVLIRDADEADIDELFARLNDGAPLTPAEARNAIAGDMSALVREVADLPELAAWLAVPDQRGSHREVAAAALARAHARWAGETTDPDVQPAGLDAFVRTWRVVDGGHRAALLDGVTRGLRDLAGQRAPGGSRPGTAAEAIEQLCALWPRLAAVRQPVPSDRTGPDSSPSE